MPATGLKIVGTGACLRWCSISSSFENSLKTSGHDINVSPQAAGFNVNLSVHVFLLSKCQTFGAFPLHGTARYGTVRFTFGGFSTGYCTWYLILF